MLAHDLMDELVADYAPLVAYVARRLMQRLPPSVDEADLVAAGMLGLLDAIAKFDPGRANKFRTYAEWRIRGAMLDELRAMDVVPRSLRDRARKLEQTTAALEGTLQRPATGAEVAAALGLDLERFHALRARLTGPAAPGDVETLPDAAADPVDSLAKGEEDAALAAALQVLAERQRLVLRLYYFDGLNLKEIGRVLGVTESRVSQLHGQALAALRRRLTKQAG